MYVSIPLDPTTPNVTKMMIELLVEGFGVEEGEELVFVFLIFDWGTLICADGR